MRTLCSILTLTFLSLVLAVSGPAGRSLASSDKILAELCIDGVVQIVRLTSEGQPVTPKDFCDQSHACCIVADDPVSPEHTPAHAALFLTIATAPSATDALIPRTEFLNAVPRGPPAVRDGQIDHMDIRS